VRLKTPSLLLAAALLATGVPAFAATTVGPAAHLVPGLYDPKTGTFKPVVTPNVNPNLATFNRDGTFVTNLTLTIKSDIPTSAPIYVEVDASTVDGESVEIYNSYEEEATKEATRTSAGAAHVSISIPYSWAHLATPTKDSVALTYTVYAGTLLTSATAFAFSRTSIQDIATLPAVPANGATTTETLAGTI
jgi:hypothetical protein